jgi:hypothetical protein
MVNFVNGLLTALRDSVLDGRGLLNNQRVDILDYATQVICQLRSIALWNLLTVIGKLGQSVGSLGANSLVAIFQQLNKLRDGLANCTM